MDVEEHFRELDRKWKGSIQEKKTEEEILEEIKKLKNKEEEKKRKRKMDNIVVLKDIDLKVKKGEFVCIIGKVGSGKTSLLKAMIGDLLPVT